MINTYTEWLTIDGNTKANRKKVQRGTVWVEKAAYNINFKPKKFKVFEIKDDYVIMSPIGGDRRNIGMIDYKSLFQNYWMENVKER